MPSVGNQITVKALRLSWKSDKHSHNKPNGDSGVKKRHSEPEDSKDIDDLLKEGDGTPKVETNTSTPQPTRHSHVVPPSVEIDPFEGLDFSDF